MLLSSNFTKFYFFVTLIISSILISCQSQSLPETLPATVSGVIFTRPPTPPVTLTRLGIQSIATWIQEPIATQLPNQEIKTDPLIMVSVDKEVPMALINEISELIEMDQGIFGWSDKNASNNIKVSLTAEEPWAKWVYVVAVPFASLLDSTTVAEVKAGWLSGDSGLGKLIVNRETFETFTALWGGPSEGVQIVEDKELVTSLWENRLAWTILPIERLTPELKVLKVDGVLPFDQNFDMSSYPFTINFGFEGDIMAVAQWMATKPDITNLDPGKLTRIAMTGVTALGRATAFQMESIGITTPGKDVAPILSSADIAHISHEIPFVTDCPFPNPIGDAVFCARDNYLELIMSLGADVIELTGNHVNDWGTDNFNHTLDLYEVEGLKTFGGGRNLEQAQKPAFFEHNGNRIAFVGCNPVGPVGQWATESLAGSLPCDYPAFYNQIQMLKNEGYLVFATLQYQEYYHYPATEQQILDFHAVADAGAAAVSGSQGHHAQGFDFYNGSFIHFGLGNLFFDQMDMLGTRQSFIDNYVIYDGKIISVELFTGLIENYCCPREMSAEERTQLLQAVFEASGW